APPCAPPSGRCVRIDLTGACRVSAPEAALALGVRAQRAQVVDPAEVGPVRLAEVELRVRALPEQEAPEPLLPGRADDELRVRLALGVQVLLDVLDVEVLREVLQSRARVGLLAQVRPHGVGDLVPPAVADRDVDLKTVDRGRALLRVPQRAREPLGEQVLAPHDAQPPAARVGEGADRVLDDVEQRGERLLRAGEVVRRGHPQRHDLDTQVLAPAEELRDLVRAPAVTGRRGLPERARPPAVPVEDDAHVARDALVREGRGKATLVESVDGAGQTHDGSSGMGGRVCRPAGWSLVGTRGPNGHTLPPGRPSTAGRRAPRTPLPRIFTRCGGHRSRTYDAVTYDGVGSSARRRRAS